MLRDYQQNIFDKVITNFSTGIQSQLLVLPTGGGKTVLFSAIAKTYTDAGKSIMMICHRQELIDQGANKLEQITGVFPGIIKAGYKYTPSQVQVASIQSLKSEKRIKPPVDLLIIDEAHHATSRVYADIVNHYKKQGTHILGVTATPVRLDGVGFDVMFQETVEEVSIKQLIGEGYLCKYKLRAAVVEYALHRNGAKADTQQELREAAKVLCPEDLVREYLNHNGKKTVVFACNVDHSKAIAQAYLDADIPAEHIDGTTPDKDRADILDRFRKGETKIISNCGILTEGFDCPNIELVQLARPTNSVSLYLQMVGRALRPSPGKVEAIILDHAKNWEVHGLPDDFRDWTKDTKKPLKCSHCNTVFYPDTNLATSKTKKISADGDVVTFYKQPCPECGTEVQWHTLSRETSEDAAPERGKITSDNNAIFRDIPNDCNYDFLNLVGQIKQQNKCALRITFKRLAYYYPWIKDEIVNNHSLSLDDIELALYILKAGDRGDAENLVYRVLIKQILRCTSHREIQDFMELRHHSISSHFYPWLKKEIHNNHSLSLQDIEMALNIVKEKDRYDAEKLVHQVLFPKIHRCTSWREIQNIIEFRPQSIKSAVWKFMSNEDKLKIKNMKQQALQPA